MDAILGEMTLRRRRKKLDEMTKGEGLGDAYLVTLSRLKAQQKGRAKLGMEVLMWVSHSERPLHVDELCQALGVEGSTDLDIQNIPAIETLITSSLGLVTIEESSSTLRLIHYTLQEYLSHNPGLFLKPHSMISEVCLTYLNFRYIRGFSPTIRLIPPTIPFVEYASCYWGAHARREITERVKSLALELLDGYDKHISSKMLLLHGMGHQDAPLDEEDSPRGFSGLHGASYLGCEEITVALLEMDKWDVPATDFNGNTAITWAARRGHSGVLKVLLERSGIDPNIADTKWDRTPLSWAAESGHEGVVEILLGRSDIDPNIADTKCRQTPLLWAAENNHKGVVRMLLERKDIDPNIADAVCGRTPLSWAAELGHEVVVRMLLDRSDANPNITGNRDRQTPLSWAAENNHEAVVRILLERNDVDPNRADIRYDQGLRMRSVVFLRCARYGQTPLVWAAERSHEAVVRMLLERNDTNPNKADTQYGRTPLSWAARSGHEAVVRMLLERSDVDPNIVDTEDGQTPLSWATERGYEGVVEMLLKRSDVDPNTADTKPLWWAAKNGHQAITRILLERNGVDPSIADTEDGRTPLSWAAESGHKAVVEMLLKRDDVDPDTADKYGRQRSGGLLGMGIGRSRGCCWNGTTSISTKLTPNMAEHRYRGLPGMDTRR